MACTKAVRSLEAFITKNYILQVFNDFKEEVAAARVDFLFFETCLQFIHFYSALALQGA